MKIYKPLVLLAIAATTLPFLWLFATIDYSVWNISRQLFVLQLTTTMGAIAGVIGMALFLWGVVLGSKEFSRIVTIDAVWMTNLHKWLGTYGSIFIFLHPLLEMYTYGENLLFLFLPSFATKAAFHITLGRLAFVLFLIIFVTSALVRGNIKYRPWKYIHYLTYPLILITFIHALDIGSTLLAYPWLEQLWIGTLLGYIVFMVYRLYNAAGLGKVKYTVTKKLRYGDNTLVLTLKPNKKYIRPKPGQYLYLQNKRFGESHPFSVMEYNGEDHTLVFGIKTFGKFTEQIEHLVLGDTLFIDGPYGVFTQEAHNKQPKVLIAGGIGITPFIDVVNKYSTEDTYVLNCNKQLSNAVYREQLQEQLGNRYVDIISDEPDELNKEIVQGRISTELISSVVPREVLTTANIFFCGPAGLYEAVKQMVMDLGVPESRIYYEEFSF